MSLTNRDDMMNYSSTSDSTTTTTAAVTNTTTTTTCRTCAALPERAKFVNDLIRNQHELSTSLQSERQVLLSTREVAAEREKQHAHLIAECSKISDEYKVALDRVVPLQSRVGLLEKELSAKNAELEQARQELDLARLRTNGAVGPDEDSAISQQKRRELEEKLAKLETKVSREAVKKRKCTATMKSLARLKSSLNNADAERLIGTLAELLGVSLSPAEQQALELERQLMSDDPKEHATSSSQGGSSKANILGRPAATGIDCSMQTEGLVVTSRLCQTFAASVVSIGVQSELEHQEAGLGAAATDDVGGALLDGNNKNADDDDAVDQRRVCHQPVNSGKDAAVQTDVFRASSVEPEPRPVGAGWTAEDHNAGVNMAGTAAGGESGEVHGIDLHGSADTPRCSVASISTTASRLVPTKDEGVQVVYDNYSSSSSSCTRCRGEHVDTNLGRQDQQVQTSSIATASATVVSTTTTGTMTTQTTTAEATTSTTTTSSLTCKVVDVSTCTTSPPSSPAQPDESCEETPCGDHVPPVAIRHDTNTYCGSTSQSIQDANAEVGHERLVPPFTDSNSCNSSSSSSNRKTVAGSSETNNAQNDQLLEEEIDSKVDHLYIPTRLREEKEEEHSSVSLAVNHRPDVPSGPSVSGQQPNHPLSLFECIPTIDDVTTDADEEKHNPESPPQGALVPRKKEKRVSFVDQCREVIEEVEVSILDNGCEESKECREQTPGDSGEDSDERTLREVEMIFAEMRHPLASGESLRELSPMPPSPVPSSSSSGRLKSSWSSSSLVCPLPSAQLARHRKRRHRDRDKQKSMAGMTADENEKLSGATTTVDDDVQRPRKRFVHQNSVGFDPVLPGLPSAAPAYLMSSTMPTEARSQGPSSHARRQGGAAATLPVAEHNVCDIGRLKAEVAHMPESGMTTFSFQIPSGGSSRISIDFDQATRQVQLSCQTPKAIGDTEQVSSSTVAAVERGAGHVTPAGQDMFHSQGMTRRSSLGFATPLECELNQQLPERAEEQLSDDQATGEGNVECHEGETSSLSSRQQAMSTPESEQHTDHSVSLSALRRNGDGDNDAQIRPYSVSERSGDSCGAEIRQAPLGDDPGPAIKNTEKSTSRSPIITIPSALKMDRRLKLLSKQRRNSKTEPLVNSLHKKRDKNAMNRSISEARAKMIQRRNSEEESYRKGIGSDAGSAGLVSSLKRQPFRETADPIQSPMSPVRMSPDTSPLLLENVPEEISDIGVTTSGGCTVNTEDPNSHNIQIPKGMTSVSDEASLIDAVEVANSELVKMDHCDDNAIERRPESNEPSNLIEKGNAVCDDTTQIDDPQPSQTVVKQQDTVIFIARNEAKERFTTTESEMKSVGEEEHTPDLEALEISALNDAPQRGEGPIEEICALLPSSIDTGETAESSNAVGTIDGIVDPPPPWILRGIGGESIESVSNENDANISESDEEMCIDDDDICATFADGPKSPEQVEILDRAVAKLIPIEFDEELAHRVYGEARYRGARGQSLEPPREALPPPESPPPASLIQSTGDDSSVTTGGENSKIIPTSPKKSTTSTEVVSVIGRRTSSRLSTKVRDPSVAKQTLITAASPSQPQVIPNANSFDVSIVAATASTASTAATPAPVFHRPVTRANRPKVTMLKESYVAEKEDYERDQLFGYDDTTINTRIPVPKANDGEADEMKAEETSFKRDIMRTISGYFKQKDGRYQDIEQLLKDVADGTLSMDSAVERLMDEGQVRKIYVSVVYVLVELNQPLTGMEDDVNARERNLVEFLLTKVSCIKKYEDKTSHAVAISCINFIRAYLMSPEGQAHKVGDLSSLLKVLGLVVRETPSEKRQLLDETYYFMADRTNEAAYLICCFLAAWPQAYSHIEYESPLGFVLRYILYHHPSTIDFEDLQRARTDAMRVGWKPLSPTESSLEEAIDRFAPMAFQQQSKTGEISRLALLAMELLLSLHGDPVRASVVLDANIPRLLAPDTKCTQWEVQSLLQLCGKVWTKFNAHNVPKVSFAEVVESLIALVDGPGASNDSETRQFCCKALWSYASYDSDSNWASRARQACMQAQGRAKRQKRGPAQNINKKKRNNNNNKNGGHLNVKSVGNKGKKTSAGAKVTRTGGGKIAGRRKPAKMAA